MKSAGWLFLLFVLSSPLHPQPDQAAPMSPVDAASLDAMHRVMDRFAAAQPELVDTAAARDPALLGDRDWIQTLAGASRVIIIAVTALTLIVVVLYIIRRRRARVGTYRIQDAVGEQHQGSSRANDPLDSIERNLLSGDTAGVPASLHIYLVSRLGSSGIVTRGSCRTHQQLLDAAGGRPDIVTTVRRVGEVAARASFRHTGIEVGECLELLRQVRDTRWDAV